MRKPVKWRYRKRKPINAQAARFLSRGKKKIGYGRGYKPGRKLSRKEEKFFAEQYESVCRAIERRKDMKARRS